MKRGAWQRVGLVAVLMGVLLVARFAIPTLIATVREAISSRLSAAVERRLLRPPPALPIRPGDYARFPRQGFGFNWSSDDKWGVDTFRGTFTTSLGASWDTTIALALTEAEMDTIYQRMIEIRLFDFPEPSPPAWGALRGPPSRPEIRFLVQAGAVRREFVWHSGEQPVDDDGSASSGFRS
jgi:hypothetical protein